MKPANMTLKEYLQKRLSVSLVVPERIIDSVITHQFDSANDALNTCKSVEISGFGKFYFNEKRAIRLMEKYLSQQEVFTNILNDETVSDQRKRNIGIKLEQNAVNIKLLKPKLNGSV